MTIKFILQILSWDVVNYIMLNNFYHFPILLIYFKIFQLYICKQRKIHYHTTTRFPIINIYSSFDHCNFKFRKVTNLKKLVIIIHYIFNFIKVIIKLK